MAERRAAGNNRRPEGRRQTSSASGAVLVVVESPKKAKTLQGILGNGYRVEASFGHVRDLPADRLGVDVDHGFAPEYVPVAKAAPRLAALRKSAAASPEVLLATDPDREGEAIAWHLATALGLRAGRFARVTFHEITRTAVQKAFQERRGLNMALVDAQQARRVLDRLVGYRLSPLLWHKVQKGTSAGRVQSVALRLIVEREREIRAFVPEEYWTIDVRLAPAASPGHADAFTARLTTIDGTKADMRDGETAQATADNLRASRFAVEGSGQQGREQSPPPPFTTSTLQQTAASRLKLPGQRTMAAAQSLFEGSYITYHRTDSVQVAEEAIAAARRVIGQLFPPEYLPAAARRYRTRSKNAQEAHEAIRPVDPARTPDAVRGELSADEARLYDLIWRRFLASQMASARYLTDELRIRGEHPQHRYGLRATATVLVFPGYLTLYGVEAGPMARAQGRNAAGDQEGAPDGARPLDDAQPSDGDADALPENARLPRVDDNAALRLLNVAPAQHFTEPPPRYSEGALVRALEAGGVGRPSTYAAIVATIQERGYVVKDRQVFRPTPLGEAANDFLVAHFPDVVNVPFTAAMEEDLDRIALGEVAWTDVLARFYGPFALAVGAAQAAAAVAVPAGGPTADASPPAAAPDRAPARSGRSGRAGAEKRGEVRLRRKTAAEWAGVAKVKPARSRRAPSAGKQTSPATQGLALAPTQESASAPVCPECGSALVERTSSYSPFLGCSQFPRCRYVQRDGGAASGSVRRNGVTSRAARGGSRTRATGGRAAPRAAARSTTPATRSPVPATMSPAAVTAAPRCPRCGGVMVERTQRATGQTFWGCTQYPQCRGSLPKA